MAEEESYKLQQTGAEIQVLLDKVDEVPDDETLASQEYTVDKIDEKVSRITDSDIQALF